MTGDYEIIRSNRKTIAIQIAFDGRVIVRCPQKMKENEIRIFVESKKKWIQKHLSKLEPQNAVKLSNDEIESLRMQAKSLIEKRAAYFASIMDVSYNRITIRAQRTRWGSCSSRGNLNFNCLLALVPPDVLDYVVVHELCHLKEMNHSARFWAELRSILPDYEKSKRWLKENGGVLISKIE